MTAWLFWLGGLFWFIALSNIIGVAVIRSGGPTIFDIVLSAGYGISGAVMLGSGCIVKVIRGLKDVATEKS